MGSAGVEAGLPNCGFETVSFAGRTILVVDLRNEGCAGRFAEVDFRLVMAIVLSQAVAAWAVLWAKVPRPMVVAGYSVGELAAWGVAGLLDYEGVLDLAVQRADAMDEATTQPSGLVAIRGLKRTTLDPICRTHGAYIAIVNGEDQMLVGGTRTALDAVIHDAQAAGAKHTTRLPVAVASHTPLLAGASDRFRQALTKARLPPRSAARCAATERNRRSRSVRRARGRGQTGTPDPTNGGLGCLHAVLPRGPSKISMALKGSERLKIVYPF